MTADLGIRENRINGRIAQLRIAEAVVAEAVFGRAHALGLLDRGAAFLRCPGEGGRIDPGVGEHHRDAGIDALLVAETARRRGEGHELAAESARPQVDLGTIVHHALGLRMDRVEVIGFGESVYPALPVSTPIGLAVLDDVHLVDLVEFELRQDRCEPRFQRLNVGVHRDEYQASGNLAANRGQVAIVAQHFGPERVGIGYRDILTLQAEFPAVEGAAELADRSERAAHQARSAVRADIVMGMDVAIVAAHDEKAFGADVEGREIARFADIGHRAGDQPALREHAVPFGRRKVAVMIAVGRRARRAIVDLRCTGVERMFLASMNVPQQVRIIHCRSPCRHHSASGHLRVAIKRQSCMFYNRAFAAHDCPIEQISSPAIRTQGEMR